MRNSFVAALVILSMLLIFGCRTASDPEMVTISLDDLKSLTTEMGVGDEVNPAKVKIGEDNTVIVLAKEVTDASPYQLTNSFTFEGNICVYITFNWEVLDYPAGDFKVAVKWYNGDRLISKGENVFSLNKTPHFVWFATRGTSLGEGDCHVEVFVEDVQVGSKSFKVTFKEGEAEPE